MRLAQPQMVSIDIYKILLNCWLENPVARPSFAKLNDDFAKMVFEPKRYLSVRNVDFEKPFITINENTDELLNILIDELADSTSLVEQQEELKKYKQKINTSNVLSDEGIDLDSFKIGSSIGDASHNLNYNRFSNTPDQNRLRYNAK